MRKGMDNQKELYRDYFASFHRDFRVFSVYQLARAPCIIEALLFVELSRFSANYEYSTSTQWASHEAENAIAFEASNWKKRDLDEDIFAKRKYLWTALDRTSRIKDRILHVNVAGVQEENS